MKFMKLLVHHCHLITGGRTNARRGCRYEVWCWHKHFKRLSWIQEASLTVADAAAGKEAFGNCLVLGLSDLTASWQNNIKVSILAGGRGSILGQ